MVLRSMLGKAITPILLVIVSALWLALWCAPALAHAGIVERQPDDGASLSRPPQQVKVTFNEPTDLAFDPLKVFDSSGERVDLDNARTAPGSPEVVVVDLEEGLPAGTYRVAYRITSVDGHVVAGDYNFTATEGNESGNAGQANAGANAGSGNRQEQAAEQDNPPPENESSGSARTVLYTALSLGALALVVAAIVGTRAFRPRKPPRVR